MTTPHAKETQDLIKVQGYSMHESLKGHYEYIGTSKVSDKVTYQCKYCGEEKSGRKNTVGNFKRHLEVSVPHSFMFFFIIHFKIIIRQIQLLCSKTYPSSKIASLLNYQNALRATCSCALSVVLLVPIWCFIRPTDFLN